MTSVEEIAALLHRHAYQRPRTITLDADGLKQKDFRCDGCGTEVAPNDAMHHHQAEVIYALLHSEEAGDR